MHAMENPIIKVSSESKSAALELKGHTVLLWEHGDTNGTIMMLPDYFENGVLIMGTHSTKLIIKLVTIV